MNKEAWSYLMQGIAWSLVFLSISGCTYLCNKDGHTPLISIEFNDTKLCPACDRKFMTTVYHGVGIHSWCGYGQCPSDAGGEGVTAPTVQEAQDELFNRVQAELASKESE